MTTQKNAPKPVVVKTNIRAGKWVYGARPPAGLTAAVASKPTVKVKTSIRAGKWVYGARPPEGLIMATKPAHVAALAAHFAEMAFLEASSVFAFDTLAQELAHHGAPVRLQRAAIRSRNEEAVHADLIGGIAQALGGTPATPSVPVRETRSLLELALDNAIEGCVREAFGALVCEYQSVAAADPRVRSAMVAVANDEAKHAAFSWQLHVWLCDQLSTSEQAEVRAAMRTAMAELRAETVKSADANLRRFAGIPTASAAKPMLDAIEAQVDADANRAA